MLQGVSYKHLLVIAVILALLPPNNPHLVEKLGMLAKGELTRPLDIFDLIFHSSPLLLILLKWITNR